MPMEKNKLLDFDFLKIVIIFKKLKLINEGNVWRLGKAKIGNINGKAMI